MLLRRVDCGLFIVRREGGEFEYLSYRDWAREVAAGAPIFGLRMGGVRIIHDRILKGMGGTPVMIVPMSPAFGG